MHCHQERFGRGAYHNWFGNRSWRDWCDRRFARAERERKGQGEDESGGAEHQSDSCGGRLGMRFQVKCHVRAALEAAAAGTGAGSLTAVAA